MKSNCEHQSLQNNSSSPTDTDVFGSELTEKCTRICSFWQWNDKDCSFLVFVVMVSSKT